MSKKRGLSAEEKRTKMLEIFHQSKDFFQLKELEKIAPKEKGITMQSVKEVIQSLVDDHLVDTEKIGISTYFWSFPSKAKNVKKRKLNDLQIEVDECAKKLKKAEDNIVAETNLWCFGTRATQIINQIALNRKWHFQLNCGLREIAPQEQSFLAESITPKSHKIVKIKIAKVGREPSDERKEILTTLANLQKQEEQLKKELQKYRDCDPEYIAQLKKEVLDLKVAINRWTENIYILKSFMKNTFQAENEVIEQNFGIPQDLDYIEI